MFEYCSGDVAGFSNFAWFACYLTSPKHFSFYHSFLTVLGLLALVTPCIMLLGFLGALARRSRFTITRWIGSGYTSMVRGIPDIVFFLFIPIALDQGLEYLRHVAFCADQGLTVYVGNDFQVCSEAKLPLSTSPQWIHEIYGFLLATLAFAVVFGAFAANVIHGALQSVPASQLETASAYGMTTRQVFWRVQLPQMWRYAIPGLSNLWMVLIKATPLLFLLGVEDIVYYARELGSTKTAVYKYSHPDWRLWYFLVLLVFYLAFTWVSQKFFDRITRAVQHGHVAMGEGA